MPLLLHRIAAALPAVLLLVATGRAAEPTCPGAARARIAVENLTDTPDLVVDVEGNLVSEPPPCAGDGTAHYATTLTCSGFGIATCGEVAGLRPGRWVHRVTARVVDSAPQRQAQRTVLLGGERDVSNVVEWTVYPRAFVVGGPTAASLQSTLAAAAEYTTSHDGPALVTFDPAAFPGAADPRRIALLQPPCALDPLSNRCPDDGAVAGLCLTGSRIVVDALDRDARPGGVELSVETCGRQAVRVYGADVVLRGLTILGSRRPQPAPPCQADTVVFTGTGARGGRLEQSLVVGPTCGDGVSIERDAVDVVVDGSRITGAANKGFKVTSGASGTLEGSCVHDNHNGGVLATLGGRVVARRNVVQHNVPGSAQHGRRRSRPAAVRMSETKSVTRCMMIRALQVLLASVLLCMLAATPAAAQCNATQLCPANANPCNISAACTINAGSTFDIRPRALVIKEGKVLTIGAGVAPVTIFAGSILFEKGGRIVATGTTGGMGSGGGVILDATTTFTMQSQGSTNSRIDVIGESTGGIVDISAGGDVDINGAILANSSSPNGFGGVIEVVSDNGAARFSGSGLQASGGGNGENGASGGSIDVFARGDVTVGAPFDVSGGDCVCDVSIESGAGSVTTTAAGDFNLRGKGGIGDGGATTFTAAGNVTLAGDVFAVARGSGGETGFGGGFGGDLDVDAGGSVVVTGRIDLDGASPDGDGGSADIQAGVDVTLNAFLGAPVEGLGSGGDVLVAAGRNLALNGTIDVGADDFGGQVDASAIGAVSIAGVIDAATPSDGLGGTILIQGCTIDTTAASRLDARGGGAFPSATNYLLGSNKTTTRGRLLAGASNRIDWLTTPPTVIPPTGAAPLITPPVTTVQNAALPCCGGSCAVCGDGIVTPDEQCDDHNTASGDCCSPTCRFEAADSACATDANACTRDVCNGAGVCIHPAGNAGAVCRAAAGVCDVAETCNGTSVACPADAKSTAPCRAAAGVCDKAESCNGVDVACPADAFEPSATVCRPSAGECDVADTCTGTSAACGADVKSVAQCRAANGSCDVAESCDGAGNACPSDGKAPDGTSCSGDACSGAGMCSGGVCGGESTTSCGPCEACDPVAGCVPALQTGCLRPTQARKAQFQIKDSSKGEVADQLSWKWLKGDATSVADFGDPTTTDGMSLCVFDRSQAAPRLIFRARVSPGRMCGTKPCWIANGAKGFKYADTLGTPDGITQMTIAPGVAGKARILVRGKGANLLAHAFGLPAPPLMLPLTVQLQSATGKCWETDHSAAGVARNTPLEFNGKSD